MTTSIDTEPDTNSDTLTRVRHAASDSHIAAGWQRTAAAVRASYLYQWLTAEPDPEVIVIDLRETWTVGPILHVLDAVIDRLHPAVADSRTAAIAHTGCRAASAAPAAAAGGVLIAFGLLAILAGVVSGTPSVTQLVVGCVTIIGGVAATRERRSWDELRDTRPVELVVATLEPPEPPSDETDNRAATASVDSRDQADTESDTDTLRSGVWSDDE